MALSKHIQTLRGSVDLAGLAEITRGLEKESLRTSATGTLAKTTHPQALGSALTHPSITVDCSESLLEFITPPSQSISELTSTLTDLHRLVYQHIGNELLWVNSMPCALGKDDDIPIAQFGHSNSGRMKSLYRLGLSHRYGRTMHTISGAHFNFSVSDTLWQFLQQQDKSPLSFKDYKTKGYLHLIRNFRRYFWLLLYLFGAAPAVCRSFIGNRQHQLIPIGNDKHSLHTPYATSLRMGNLGYQSSAQNVLTVTYNCLESYTQTLLNAIMQPHPDYVAIGLKDGNGQHKQLNDGLLQIENEFYSVIRPKRTTKSGQSALNALLLDGIEYIEVRCLDINPYDPIGVNEDQIRFLDIFLLFCLLEDSPLSDKQECQHLKENQHRMVYQGRNPALKLYHFGEERHARQWANQLFDQLRPIADLLDKHHHSSHYIAALNKESQKVDNDQLTPSAQIITGLKEQNTSFYQWAMDTAITNKAYFKRNPLSDEKRIKYREISAYSWKKQAEMEADTTLSFEQFLAQYYDQYKHYDQYRPE